MKLTIMSEPLTNTSHAKSRFDRDLEALPEEVAVMVATDLHQRQEKTDNPETIHPRSPQEIITELGRNEYNAWHNLWRQDRQSGRLCSYEAWNAYGSQDARSMPSAEDEFLRREEEKARLQLSVLLANLISDLPPVQRLVLIAVLIEGRPAVEVAAERGVSKAAISKTLKKATERLRQALIALGVNSADVSGLLLSEAQGSAQEGKNK